MRRHLNFAEYTLQNHLSRWQLVAFREPRRCIKDLSLKTTQTMMCGQLFQKEITTVHRQSKQRSHSQIKGEKSRRKENLKLLLGC